jgi:uroporphyrinogen decarboxylase
MNSKDRMIATLNHKEPDLVPTGENHVNGNLVEELLGHHTLYNKGWEELEALWNGRRDQIVKDYSIAHVELPRVLGWDYVRVPAVPAKKTYRHPRMAGPQSWIDEQGYEVHFNPAVGNVAMRSKYPDLSIDDLPNPGEKFSVDPSELEAIQYVVRELKDSHFIIGRLPIDGTFPYAETVGMEEFLVRMITNPEFVHRAIDAYVSRSIAYINAFFDEGVDAIMTTDDYADNRSLLMGKERFREFIIPGLKRQCEAIHIRGGYFIKHTDGYMWEALDDMVKIGIDGWHGIQPSIGMDLKLLKEKYKNKICLFGGVNCETLINGSAKDIINEVKYAIKYAAPGGGFVLTSGNALEPGTKKENYLVMLKANRDFGTDFKEFQK